MIPENCGCVSLCAGCVLVAFLCGAQQSAPLHPLPSSLSPSLSPLVTTALFSEATSALLYSCHSSIPHVNGDTVFVFL